MGTRSWVPSLGFESVIVDRACLFPSFPSENRSRPRRLPRWDVSSVVGRAGQIRIVDASSESPWGHINVDEIKLSWDSRGGIHPER